MDKSKQELKSESTKKLEQKEREFEYERNKDFFEIEKTARQQEIIRRNTEVCLSAYKLVLLTNQDSEKKLKEEIINKISELIPKLKS